MLDRLPVELLRLVLGQLAPLDYTPERYKQRRSDLRSCCLVTRTLRTLAQPMLPEVFEVRAGKDATELAVTVGGQTRGTSVRLLVLWHLRSSTAHRAIKHCPNLVDLRVCETKGVFKLERLANQNNLHRLILSGGRVRPPGANTFPALVELSMCAGSISTSFFLTSPTPSMAPRLRALGLAALTGVETDGNLPLSNLSAELLEQLEALSLDYSDNVDTVSHHPAYASTILLDVGIGARPPPEDLAKVALRLYLTDHDSRRLSLPLPLPPNQRHFLCDYVSDVTSTLGWLASPARTFLPAALEPTRVLETELSDEVLRLLAVLEGEGAEVVWEEQADWDYDSLVSPGFWRHRREDKARMSSAANAE